MKKAMLSQSMAGKTDEEIVATREKWSDEEPWLIEDLKKLEVVDSYE